MKSTKTLSEENIRSQLEAIFLERIPTLKLNQHIDQQVDSIILVKILSVVENEFAISFTPDHYAEFNLGDFEEICKLVTHILTQK